MNEKQRTRNDPADTREGYVSGAHKVRPKLSYYIGPDNDGLIKIGQTHDANARLRQLREQYPGHPLELLGTAPEEEWVLHARFKHLREHGEWFRPEPDLLAEVFP